jgi:YbbR domain-containing protein
VSRLPGFLRRLSWKELLLRSSSFLIAIGLWAGVLGSKKEEFLKTYELTYKFGPEMTHSNSIPLVVQAKLYGPKAFVRAVTQKRFSPIVIDLTQAQLGTTYLELDPEDVPVPIGIQTREISPATIPVRIEKEIQRELPLKIEVMGKVRDGFQIKSLYLAPRSRNESPPFSNRLSIRGASSLLESLSSLRTKPVELDSLKGMGEIPVDLDLENLPGLKLAGDVPPIRYEVAPIEGSFRLRAIPIEVQSNYRSVLEVTQVSAIVRATAEKIATLKSRGIVAKVNLLDKNKGKYREKVEINLPSGVTLIRVMPEKVNVLLVD